MIENGQRTRKPEELGHPAGDLIYLVIQDQERRSARAMLPEESVRAVDQLVAEV